MRDILDVVSLGTLLLLSGCSTAVRRGPPAPVDRGIPVEAIGGDRGKPSAPAEISTYPAREAEGTELFAYPSSGSSAPEVGASPRDRSALPLRSDNPAVIALLSSAGRQQQGGDLSAAAATLERALRIEPRNARLWHQLAALRLTQQRYQLAADLAEKSNSLAPDDTLLRRNNWQLIARAREALGDRAGAQQAERLAR